ncbi:hypothetical protein [Sabulicella glaciei]|uniref:TIM-barrel domain-containing protein n=1 Tax=Sabulicella glaciei TaxID=2984948 RepID=A0ABT3NPR2_9PROT|nr:hypothetical protein [Roseococcus sp. MDT2-1-1]MCW8084156.1 hypothetical protein [Roseococcus sp. MDT2-1-1]
MTLRPTSRLDGASPQDRAASVFLPCLSPFPAKLWPLVAHLPVLDVNGTLAAALAGCPALRASPPVAGIFACDPFLRVPDLAEILGRAGFAEVVNHPSVQAHEGEAAAALSAVGYRAEAEFRVLLRFREQGMRPIARAATRQAVEVALALGLRRILLHPPGPGPAPPGWWDSMAAHVVIEGGEALAWSDAPPQTLRPRRRMRL